MKDYGATYVLLFKPSWEMAAWNPCATSRLLFVHLQAASKTYTMSKTTRYVVYRIPMLNQQNKAILKTTI